MFRFLLAPRVRHALPWLVCFCGVLLVVALWINVDRSEENRITQDVRLTAGQVRLRLQAWAENRAAAMRLFAGQHAHRQATGVTYEAIASRVIGLYPGFQALNFVDAEGVIRVVVPLRGNEPALNRNLYEHPDPHVGETLALAAAGDNLCAGPVIDLLQGGRGLTTYQAVRGADGTLQGFINGVFRVDRLVDACLAEEPLRANFRFRLRDTDGTVIYAHPADDTTAPWPYAARTEVLVLGAAWELEMAPSTFNLDRSATWTDEFLGLVGLLLVALITGLMVSHLRGLDQLAESQQRYRLLVEHASDMIVRLDAEGRFLYVSPSYCATFGKSEEELLGRSFLPLVHEEDRAETERQMARLAEPPHTCYLEQRAMTAEGWRWLAWSDTAEVDPEGAVQAIIGVGRDITARKELEEQLRRFQKLQAVGQLAGGIAHDFNNILQAMMGNLSFVRDALPADHPAQQDLALVEKSAERAGELTRQLLAFGSRQLLRPVIVDVNSLLDDHIRLLRRLIGEGIALVFEPGHLSGNVLADPGQLEQVMMNLCVNARDAIGMTGHIVITTSEQDIVEAPLGSDLEPGPYVLITVRDDGEGMDEAVRDRIFEPFFTTKDTGRGTGLGLATIYGIVSQHRGHVAVESRLGEGSAFTVYLPRVDNERSTDAGRPRDEAPGGTETILLAEDDEDVRAFVARALESAGYRVIIARDGAAAVALARSRPGGFQLALLDVVMPKLDGPSAARQIRAIAPDVGLVFASGYAPDEDRRVEEEFAGSAFIAKPYEVDALLRVLRGQLDA
jgi:PAS domain S-box-containing protein